MKTTMCGVYKEAPRSGAVFRTDLPIPKVGERDILVRVRATAICGTDLHIMSWTEYAQNRVIPPMVFGHEFAGHVVEVGSKVTEVRVGDRVAGETHIPCNECYQCKIGNRHICENMKIIGVHTPGSFAEYISFPVDCAYKIADNIDYKVGAMLEPMGVAVHGVDAANVKDQVVAIFGCGPIGLMAVGAANVLGAKKIFAIDIFNEKLNIALKMGADVVINSRNKNVVQEIMKQTRYGADVVIDYTGNEQAILQGFSVLKKGGKFVMVGLPNNNISMPVTEDIIYKEATVIGVTGRLMYQTWEQCERILQSPKFNIEPVIGGIYPLCEFQKAFAAIEKGTPGKMILTI
mgnify:CR=1 FL=1